MEFYDTMAVHGVEWAAVDAEEAADISVGDSSDNHGVQVEVHPEFKFIRDDLADVIAEHFRKHEG